MLIKCKMCGFDIEVNEDQSICECEFCHSKQTIPTLDNDDKIGYFNRANLLRIRCEYDKAIEEYDSLIQKFPNDPEAYWGKCLSKYGIEYVDDPKTNSKIPTCHRTRLKSILKDEDYLKAIETSNEDTKAFYEKEATEIDRLQKEILKISNKEEPYDIFICYKETDNNGDRTPDSVISQEIYDKLVEKGYKVFFSRITLESKLGLEYEPIIYAALKSSKVMLAVGTSISNFNAVWVKNEWSRFIDFMKEDNNKYLIPCYKNMNAYDMPLEFVPLQSQDVSKVGYMQDLMRGIDKIFNKDEKLEDYEKINQMRGINIPALLKRTEILLDNEEFEKASEIVDEILNNDPENAKAYIFQLLIQLNLTSESQLANSNVALNEYKLFNIAYKFADKKYKKVLDNYLAISIETAKEYSKANNKSNTKKAKKENKTKKANTIKVALAGMLLKLNKKKESIKKSANEVKKTTKEHVNKAKVAIKTTKEQIKKAKETTVETLKETIVNGVDDLTSEALKKIKRATKEHRYFKAQELVAKGKYSQAIEILQTIIDYRDSEDLIDNIKQLKVKIRKYDQAEKFKNNKFKNSKKRIFLIKQAITIYDELGVYKDSNDKKIECQKLIKLIKRKDNIVTSVLIVLLVLVCLFSIKPFISIVKKSPSYRYDLAMDYIEKAKYNEAADILHELKEKEYKDSANQLLIALAGYAMERNDYDRAVSDMGLIDDSIIEIYYYTDSEISSDFVRGDFVNPSYEPTKIGYDFKEWKFISYSLINSENTYALTINFKAVYDKLDNYTTSINGINLSINGDIVTIISTNIYDSTSIDIERCLDEYKGVIIADEAFYNYKSLKEIKLPNNLIEIGKNAFHGCISLESIVIPASVKKIKQDAFYECINLQSIMVEQDNSKYDSRDHCNAIIDTETNELILGCSNSIIPIGVTSIGDFAFSSCSGLTSITIPYSVKTIGRFAFSNCENLKIIVIPNGVTSIYEYAFYNCIGLTRVSISSSVTFIDAGSFSQCSNLTDIYYKGTKEQWNKINIDSDNNWLKSRNIHYEQ